LVETPERPTVHGGETGLTALAARHFLPTTDSRRKVKEEPIDAMDGYKRVTPPQAIKIEPGYYVRLVLRAAAIAVTLAAVVFVLYLFMGFVL